MYRIRYYDVLEDTLRNLQEWKANETVSKNDVIDSVRERLLTLMTHVISTPLIGTAYAYPGDLPFFENWVDSQSA